MSLEGYKTHDVRKIVKCSVNKGMALFYFYQQEFMSQEAAHVAAMEKIKANY
jgi:hypothetical protein